MQASIEQKRLSGPLITFGVLLLLMAATRIAAANILIPGSWLEAARVLITVIFVGLPVVAIFYGAKFDWTPARAGIFLGVSVVAWGALYVVAATIAKRNMDFNGVVTTLMDVDMFFFCLGLGALIASSLKDKNLIVPISIFLILFDVFLVLTPEGPTRQLIVHMPTVLAAIGHGIPEVGSIPKHGHVVFFASVGPADFLFLSMFFVALSRFQMRAAATLGVLLPILLAYLLLTRWLSAVPLLVPIGIAVLAVNLRDFKLTRQEWLGTGLVALLGVGLITWSATRPDEKAPPPPIWVELDAQGLPKSAGSPAQVDPSRPRSASPLGAKSKPSPP